MSGAGGAAGLSPRVSVGSASLAVRAVTAGAELSYLYLLLALLRENLGLGYLGFALICVLYLLPLLLGLMEPPGSGQPDLRLVRALAVALVLGVAALAVGQVLAAGQTGAGVILQVGAGGLAWFLGNSLMRGGTEYRRICFRVQIGIVVVLVLAAAGGSPVPVVLFFVLAVFAVSLARWQSSASSSSGVLQALPLRQVMLANLSVLVPSLLVFAILSPGAVGAAVAWLLRLADWISGLAGPGRPPSPDRPIDFNFSCSFKPGGEGASPPPEPREGPAPTISPWVLWLFAGAVLAGVVLLVILTIRRVRARRPAEGEPMAIEIRSMTVGLLGELARLLRRLVAGLRRFFTRLIERARGAHIRRTLAEEPAGSVRAVYRSLLRWAVRQGLPRTDSQTPLEYLGTLRQRFPERDTELTLITGVYLQARYSRDPASGTDFDSAMLAWDKVRRSL